MSITDLTPSGWSYETGATGGLGVAFVAGSGGALYLNPPGGGQETFYFGALGAGWSFGFKIPKLPKVQLRGKSIAGAGSIKQFPSGGLIWRRESLGKELTKSDIQGGVVFVEGAIGLGVGASGDAMLFGINPAALMGGLATLTVAPQVLTGALMTAKGAMTFGGVNVGLQAGGGIAGLVGLMY